MSSFFKHTILLELFVTGWLVCASNAADQRYMYLAVCGPTPVRFQTLMPEYDPAKVLPALQMSDTPFTNSVPAEIKPAQVATPAPAPEPAPVAVTPPPPEITLPVEPPVPAVPEQKPDLNQITPQMLLRYFRQDGAKEIVIPAPLEFTPPTPSSDRSSATYSSPPAK